MFSRHFYRTRALAALTILLLGSCSWLGDAAETPTEAASSENLGSEEALAKSESAESSTKTDALATRVETPTERERISAVEVRWQVPADPVDAYQLNYGVEESNLDKSVRVSVSELQKVSDPSFGPVYVYQLVGIDKSKPLYLTLRAENKHGISPPSPVLKAVEGRFTQLPRGQLKESLKK